LSKKYQPLPALSSKQWSIINGSLLGDGSISPQRNENNNCNFVKVQADRHLDYIDWHFDELLPYSSSVGKRPVKKVEHDDLGKMYLTDQIVSTQLVYVTKKHPNITHLRKKWYPNDKKTVPEDITLDELTVAIWFCDDGQNVPTRRTAYFWTNGFSKNECILLCDKLKALNINSGISKDGDHSIIRIKSSSYLDFINMLTPYIIWDSFGYKVDLSKYEPYQPKGLSELQAAEVIHQYFDGRISIAKLAKRYQVRARYIKGIVTGELWSSLPRPDIKYLRANNTSGHRNIYWDKNGKRWRVTINRNGKLKNIGRFVSLEDALIARDRFFTYE
jgi:hypothetical protein